MPKTYLDIQLISAIIKIDNQSYDIEQGCDHHHRNRLITDNQQ